MESNTLTMENNVETTDINNLSDEEQDSLQVGQELQDAQDNLLAGKYKNAQELEQGYIELQKKLGQSEETAEAEETVEPEQNEPEQQSVLDRIWEESNKQEEFSP